MKTTKALQVLQAGGKTPIHHQSNEDRKAIAEVIVKAVQDGSLSPLEAHQAIKAWEKIFKEVSDSAEFKRAVLDEAAPYEKRFLINSNELEKSEAGVTYDYSMCGDPEYAKLLIDFKHA